jgi:hypothetical protein
MAANYDLYSADFTTARTRGNSGAFQNEVAVNTTPGASVPSSVNAAAPAALNISGGLSASMNSYPTFPNPARMVEQRLNQYVLPGNQIQGS